MGSRNFLVLYKSENLNTTSCKISYENFPILLKIAVVKRCAKSNTHFHSASTQFQVFCPALSIVYIVSNFDKELRFRGKQKTIKTSLKPTQSTLSYKYVCNRLEKRRKYELYSLNHRMLRFQAIDGALKHIC